jgi:hypothetical protein
MTPDAGAAPSRADRDEEVAVLELEIPVKTMLLKILGALG